MRRIIADVTAAADVVGLTIAEFLPRQVMHLQHVLASFPLMTPPAAGRGSLTRAGPPRGR